MQSNQTPSREELAAAEIGATEISRAQKWVLSLFFLTLIFSVPVLQRMQGGAGASSSVGSIADAWSVFTGAGAGPSGEIKTHFIGRLVDANRVLLRGIRDTEDSIADSSFLTHALLPPTQLFLTTVLGAGNEQAYPGTDRRLFYRPGIDSITGPGFLEEKVLAARARGGNEWAPPTQPDPVAAIHQFHRQLEDRGIQLILVPTPVKASLHPEWMSGRYRKAGPVIRNPSYNRWIDSLDEGVLVFDPAPLLAQHRNLTGAAQYLESDTHWTPQAMQHVAAGLSRFICEHIELSDYTGARLTRHAGRVRNPGDIAAMLTLPSSQRSYPDQAVDILEVRDNETSWQSDTGADVLVLGDSFSNIYSLDSMGWGASAGFVEQLSFELARPVDSILRNDGGAHETREMLSRELARGRDRLGGKRVVVWQFSERELAVGDWRTDSTPMVLGEGTGTSFLELATGETIEISGVVQEISRAPRPGTVPYADHVISIHVADLQSQDVSRAIPENAFVAMQSMRDKKWTAAARYRIGDVVELKLFNYNEMDARAGIAGMNTAPLDSDVSLEDPVWGEPILNSIEKPPRGRGNKFLAFAVVFAGVASAVYRADRNEREGTSR
jgi:alginate O-acetyltransferase complex protein AlgJ